MRNKHLPFTVPDGYFENLPERLMQRCDEHEAARGQRRSLWSGIRSQLAFAAGFALLAGLAYVAVRYTQSLAHASADGADATCAISALDLENFLLQAPDSDDDNDDNDELDDEAIVSYLLCSEQMLIAMDVGD
ncbi:MAG: hypothetical protein LBH84_09380 [Prevotellaceae bacterium]|jgi:hypothetical protein|nr:hypothetical protein [Prevotellaceae bacterium]